MHIRKIVLADDEGTQCRILSSIIQKITPGTQIELCANGKEAWEKIQTGDTELLITDIRMPVMDGMELIRLVSAAFPNVIIILISAFQEFEYAKNAISCGVSEYLVKPFRIDDVRRILEKAAEQIRAKREENEKNSLYETMLLKACQDSQQKQLIDLMRGRKLTDRPDGHLCTTLQHPGLIAVVCWKNRSLILPPPTGISFFMQERLMEFISDLFENALFVPLENHPDSALQQLALLLPGIEMNTFHLLSAKLVRKCTAEGIVFWMGVSEPQVDLYSSLHVALTQAEEVALFRFYSPKEPMIFSYSELNGTLDLPTDSLSGFEKELREATLVCNTEKLTQQLALLKKEIQALPNKHPRKVRHRVSSMIVSILKDLDGMISAKEYDEILNNAYYQFNLCDSCDNLISLSHTLLEKAAAYFIQESGQYDAVEDIISYIKKHFTEELSLQQLADRVHFSANYLSTQIKRKTGMAYAGYIGWLRTEMACKLLTETDYRVMEIATRCGYRDSSYFNRIFCRKYGLTPEQYRKAHKKC